MTEEQRARVNELWLEFKVAAQYDKPWERVESDLEAVEIRLGIRAPRPQFDAPTISAMSGWKWILEAEKPGAPDWKEGVPDWFAREELGIGSRVDYFRTQATLRPENERRRKKFQQNLTREEAELRAALDRKNDRRIAA